MAAALPSQESGASSRGSSCSRSGSDEDSPPVTVVRAELVRGHRPVVVSEVPVYIALKDKEGRLFEAKGNSDKVRFRWSRGPEIKPCIFHPHKMSTIKDVAKTYQCYCSKECFLRGWHNLPQHMWGPRVDQDVFEEPLAEWVEVARDKSYCPTVLDIDRPLRLDIIPIAKNGRDSRRGCMSVTTGTVIPTPKEARTRRMISNGGTFNAEWLSQQFKVMNWNILADLYATEPVYPYCEKWALSWTWRKHLILKELKSMTADIITLQEVQKDAYDEWFKPQLAEAGYEGIFQQKKRDPIFHRGKYTSEGCATFYKTTRLKRVDKLVIDYDKLSMQEIARVSEAGVSDKAMQRLSKGNIALAVILEDLHIKATHSSQATGPNGGHVLCVVNTHILCDPGAGDVKLWQAHLLVQVLSQMPTENMPLLICGDFNSTPDSAVYEYMRKGSISEDHVDLKVDPFGLLKHLEANHSLEISSAYKTCSGSEASYTNYTEDFKGTLDYIWFSSRLLAVLAISQVDDESQLAQETALPSSTRPSDHVSLVATFMFRGPPPEESPTASRTPQSAGRGHSQLLANSGGYHLASASGLGGTWMTSSDPQLYVGGSAAGLYSGYMQ